MRDFLYLQDNKNCQLSAGKENRVAPPTLWTSVAALNSPNATDKACKISGDLSKKKKKVTKFCMFEGFF